MTTANGLEASCSFRVEARPGKTVFQQGTDSLRAGTRGVVLCPTGEDPSSQPPQKTSTSAIKAFKEAGKRIPEDIAVVGFDNIPMSQVMDLSTINVPKEYMGRLAAKRLFDRIRNPRLPTVKIAVETTLIDRYSC